MADGCRMFSFTDLCYQMYSYNITYLFYTLHLGGSTLGVGWIPLEHPEVVTQGLVIQSAAPMYLGSMVLFKMKQALPELPRV